MTMATEHDGAADDKPKVEAAGARLRLPRRRWRRIALGLGLVMGGALGFLPVLGFWMIPLGVVVLAYDLPAAERVRRAVARRVARRRGRR